MINKDLVVKKRDYFQRNEGSNVFIISSLGVDNSLLLNKSGQTILNDIEQSTKVIDLIKKMSLRFPDIPYSDISRDVEDMLLMLYKYDVIDLIGENVMENKNTIGVTDRYEIVKLSEIDFKIIFNYLLSEKGKKSYVNSNNNEYTSLTLRNKLFSYSEEFYALLNEKKETVGIISFNRNMSKYGNFYTTGVIQFDQSLDCNVISEFIEKASTDLYNDSKYNCKKIRASYYYTGENGLHSVLENAGYCNILQDKYVISDIKEAAFDFIG